MGFGRQESVPRYNRRPDPMWTNEKLIRNRSVIYSPGYLYDKKITDPGMQILQLLTKIPKHLSQPGCKARKSAEDRLFGYSLTEDKKLQCLNIFVYDKVLKDKKAYKEYAYSELGVSYVMVSNNLLILEWENGTASVPIFIHLAEFITWMGELEMDKVEDDSKKI